MNLREIIWPILAEIVLPLVVVGFCACGADSADLGLDRLAAFGDPPVPVAPGSRLQGDVDGDGRFGDDDLAAVLEQDRYDAGRASWSQGDWDRDGLFTRSDLQGALRGERSQSPAFQVAPATFSAGLRAKKFATDGFGRIHLLGTFLTTVRWPERTLQWADDGTAFLVAFSADGSIHHLLSARELVPAGLKFHPRDQRRFRVAVRDDGTAFLFGSAVIVPRDEEHPPGVLSGERLVGLFLTEVAPDGRVASSRWLSLGRQPNWNYYDTPNAITVGQSGNLYLAGVSTHAPFGDVQQPGVGVPYLATIDGAGRIMHVRRG